MAARAQEFSPPESDFMSLLSGWAQQGVQAVFATHRILLDLAMRQNAAVMNAIKEQLSNPCHSPATILGEAAEEGFANFVEGQKVLLELAKEQNEILLTGVKQRVGECPRRQAMVDLLRRSVATFLQLQENYLQTAHKETRAWMEEAKAGKPYQPEHIFNLVQKATDAFINAQKEYLKVVVQETATITTGKANGAEKKVRKTELPVLAKESMESFIEAQKQLVEIAGQQLTTNVKNAGKALEMLQPLPLFSVNELTREVVKSYVDAQKTFMGMMTKPKPAGKARRAASRGRKAQAKATAAA